MVPHAVLDTCDAYPLWLGLGQSFSLPKLPEYVPEVPRIEEEKIDTTSTAPGGVGTDTSTVIETPVDTTSMAPLDTTSEEKVESHRLLAAWFENPVVQDTSVRPVYSQIEMQKILDTLKTVHFRFKFDIAGSPQPGRVYFAGDGFFEFYLNGAYIGSALAEEEDERGDSLEVTDLFAENFVQGRNVLAVVLRDGSPQQRHGLRALLVVNEVEDATAEFAEPPMPKGDILKEALYRRGRVGGR
jgi:hypothetical protein